MCYRPIVRIAVYVNDQFLQGFHYESCCLGGLDPLKSLNFQHVVIWSLPVSSSTVTLWCRQPQVTPPHWQRWMLWFQELITMRGSWVILALNSGNANWSVSLLPPTTKVINMPYQHKTIKTPIQKKKRFVKVEELNSTRKAPCKVALATSGF